MAHVFVGVCCIILGMYLPYNQQHVSGFLFFYFSGNFCIPIFSNSLHLDPLVWFEKWSLVGKLVPVTHRGSLCLYTYLLTNWKNASLCVKVGRSSVELHCCCSPGCRVEMFLWHFTGRYEKQSYDISNRAGI